jgi:putative restriction endonuclease
MSDGERRSWTRDELILAINLYCKTPFGKIHVRNPDIINLAKFLGRTPGSVSYKLANFASIDPSLTRKGASNVSRLDKEVWNEFFKDWDEMAFESEKKASEIRGENFDSRENIKIPDGKTRDAIVRIRVNQNFFRKLILSSYDFTCCITGMSVAELLVASHIIPWSVDCKNRMNPQNGICLNALHDKAFDLGLITFDESYRVVVSSRIRKMAPEKSKMIADYVGIKMKMPNRFIPDQNLLKFHRNTIFLP